MRSCCSGLLHRLPTASSSVCCFGFSVSPFPCITVGVISYNLFRFHPAANHSFLRVFIRFSVSHRLSAKEFLHPFTFFIGQVLQQCVSVTYPQPGGFVCVLCTVSPCFCSALTGCCSALPNCNYIFFMWLIKWGWYRGCFSKPLPAVSCRKRRPFFASTRSTVTTPMVSASVLNDSQPLFQSFSASVVQLVLCREYRSFGLEVPSACFSWRQFLFLFRPSKSCLISTFIRQSPSVFHPSALSAHVIPEQSSVSNDNLLLPLPIPLFSTALQPIAKICMCPKPLHNNATISSIFVT